MSSKCRNLVLVCSVFALLSVLQLSSYRLIPRVKNIGQDIYTTGEPVRESSLFEVKTEVSNANAAGTEVEHSWAEGRKKPLIAVVLCATTKGLNRKSLKFGNLALVKFAVPSMLKTLELERFKYAIYVGVDDDDQFWTVEENQKRVAELTGEKIRVEFRAFKTKPNRVPFNLILKAAADDGADYLVRINDDSEFVTQRWSSMGVNTLASYDPPNVGVVGPTCNEGNIHILTHDMVHRTHMKIFNGEYYPSVFDNWWVDDWITGVYSKQRTTKLAKWVIRHHVTHHSTRYHVDHSQGKQLKDELAKGRSLVKEYLSQLACVLPAGAQFKGREGEDKALFEFAYENDPKCEGTIIEISGTEGLEMTTSFVFETALKWKSVIVEPNAATYNRVKQNRPKATAVHGSICDPKKDSGASCQTFGQLFGRLGVDHVDVIVIDAPRLEPILEVMDWSVTVDYWVVDFDGQESEEEERILRLFRSHGYYPAGWEARQWCANGNCGKQKLFIRPVMNLIVLTMNRKNSLHRLLNSLEAANYGTDTVALSIMVDHAPGNGPVIKLAEEFSFTHGPKVVQIAPSNLGLAKSWFESWYPPRDSSRAIILEDDVEVSPKWYQWVKSAWNAYEHRQDIAGISLQRQTLVPQEPSKTAEIVNRHEPFLYSLVGSIGFSPHPVQWRKFMDWLRSIDLETFDVSTPGLVTSRWWKVTNKRHMWTQHFIYFCKKFDLYTLYINLPEKETLGAHWREKGEHYGSRGGRDFVLAQKVEMEFPKKLAKYGWDAKPVRTYPTRTCAEDFPLTQYDDADVTNQKAGKQLVESKIAAGMICKLLKNSSRVLEWGSSGTTLFFSKFVASWDSVEHDQDWASIIGKRINNMPHVNLHVTSHTWSGKGDGKASEFVDYINRPKGFKSKPYDVVLINGRARVECAKVVLQSHLLASPAGRVVVFNWERASYRAVLKEYAVENEARSGSQVIAVLVPKQFVDKGAPPTAKPTVRVAHKPNPVPTTFHPVMNDKTVLDKAEEIYKKHGVVLIQLLNQGFLQMTKSWICNVKSFNTVLDKTLFVTTEDVAYDSLVSFDETLHVVLKPYATPAEMSYGQYQYYDYMLFRTRFIVDMLERGITLWLVESDAVWLHDPVALVLNTTGDMVTMSDDGPGKKLLQGGFQLLRHTELTKTVWKKLLGQFIAKMARLSRKGYLGDKGSEQLLLDRLIRQVKGLKVSWLPPEYFVPGLYYRSERYRNSIKDPYVILNNWVIGNDAKIARAKKWKHWYLGEDGQCLQQPVEESTE